MKKLTAEECRILIGGLSGNRSIREDKYLAALEIALPALEQQEKGNDGWADWCGEECPVENKSLVEVKFRNGKTNKKHKAGEWDWYSCHEIPMDYHIIAYRVIENDGREG